MRVMRRIGLLAGALGLAYAAAPLAGVSAAVPGLTTIDVRGTLLVAQSDGPSGGSTSYAVELAHGDLVPVHGEFPADVRTGASFHGRLAIPASVSRVAASAASALRVVDDRGLTLSVVGTPTLTAAPTSRRPRRCTGSSSRRSTTRGPWVRATRPCSRTSRPSGPTGRTSPTAPSAAWTCPRRSRTTTPRWPRPTADWAATSSP